MADWARIRRGTVGALVGFVILGCLFWFVYYLSLSALLSGYEEPAFEALAESGQLVGLSIEEARRIIGKKERHVSQSDGKTIYWFTARTDWMISESMDVYVRDGVVTGVNFYIED